MFLVDVLNLLNLFSIYSNQSNVFYILIQKS